MPVWYPPDVPVADTEEFRNQWEHWFLALNCIIGGLIGGVVLIFKIIGIAGELISIVTGHFWTKSPKVEI